MHVLDPDLVHEVEDIPTDPARLAIPAARLHRVLERRPTAPPMPGAPTHALRIRPIALLPAVVVKHLVLEHQLLQPRPQEALHFILEEPPPDLTTRHSGLPELGINGLLIRVTQPLHGLAMPPQHRQDPLRRQFNLLGVVIQPPIPLLRLRVD